MEAASLLMIGFAVVAGVDGLYLHLWKYTLFARRASFMEHVTHTLHAALFPVTMWLLFSANRGGAWLWAAVGVAVIDQGVQSWDILIERSSRAALGGLTSLEYWLHALAISLHVSAVAIVLVLKPAAAWSLSAPAVLADPYPSIAATACWLTIPGAAAIAALHAVLCLPRFRTLSA